MIDIFALLLVHGILAVALWRLVRDDSVDHEDLAPVPEKPGEDRTGEDPLGGDRAGA